MNEERNYRLDYTNADGHDKTVYFSERSEVDEYLTYIEEGLTYDLYRKEGNRWVFLRHTKVWGKP